MNTTSAAPYGTISSRPDASAWPSAPDWARTAALDDVITRELSKGGRLEYCGADTAVIVRGRPVSHAFHAIATVATCWLWAVFVWLPCVLLGGQRRTVLTVDDAGYVHTQTSRT